MLTRKVSILKCDASSLEAVQCLILALVTEQTHVLWSLRTTPNSHAAIWSYWSPHWFVICTQGHMDWDALKECLECRRVCFMSTAPNDFCGIPSYPTWCHSFMIHVSCINDHDLKLRVELKGINKIISEIISWIASIWCYKCHIELEHISVSMKSSPLPATIWQCLWILFLSDSIIKIKCQTSFCFQSTQIWCHHE